MFPSQLLTKSELFGDAFYFREGHINSSAWPNVKKTGILSRRAVLFWLMVRILQQEQFQCELQSGIRC